MSFCRGRHRIRRFHAKNHPYMGNCLIGYYQDQTHGYDQGQEGGGIELKTIE